MEVSRLGGGDKLPTTTSQERGAEMEVTKYHVAGGYGAGSQYRYMDGCAGILVEV